MTISALELFSIGIGPSSSHTVGPMKAALRFITEHPGDSISVELRGSLAATGKGHGTDRAIVLGLAGHAPDTVPASASPAPGEEVPAEGTTPNGIAYRIAFNPEPLPQHPNAVVFSNENGESETYYSVGGGFVLSEAEMTEHQDSGTLRAGAVNSTPVTALPYYFTTGARLLTHCNASGLSISEIMAANEAAIHGDIGYVDAHLTRVWTTMRAAVTAGISTRGILPGGLHVQRRAPIIYAHLINKVNAFGNDAFGAMDWVNLFALAVNEENAAGGRVVTAPTNGAAGIIPAVLHYARDFLPGFTSSSARTFLFTAAAIGIIVKENASISGAEVGCQGEVGTAAAMAAAGLCELQGGSPEEVCNAAEIALEHNLGLTCDPVGGLVQIPCIERNAIAAVQAINAARLARLGSGIHHVSLDDAVRTMADTGRDMLNKYKETATGGLAVNVGLPVALTEC